MITQWENGRGTQAIVLWLVMKFSKCKKAKEMAVLARGSTKIEIDYHGYDSDSTEIGTEIRECEHGGVLERFKI